jgi:hypothetical protein
MGGDLSDDLSGYEGDDRIYEGPGHDAWIWGGPGKTPFAVVRAETQFSAQKVEVAYWVIPVPTP